MSSRTHLRPLAVLLAALLLLGGIFRLWQRERDGQVYTGTSFLMNTVVEYKLYGPNGQQAHDAVEQALRQIEREMSRYIDDSQISRLNANRTAALSAQTFSLLRQSLDFHELSGGLFDVSIAPLTALWGITEVNPRVPSQEEIAALLPLVDSGAIILSEQDGGYTAELGREGMQLDLGGVAKGYTCKPAREAAQEWGITSGYVSIGGNLMVIGTKPSGEDFRFGVRDPRGGPNDFFAVVTLPDSTMATSGDYERYFEQDGVRYHHILDPRTGQPAQSGLRSVSVISEDGAYADFLSTYLFVAGREALPKLMQQFSQGGAGYAPCGIIAVDDTDNVHITENLRGRVTPVDETGRYHFPKGWS